MYCASRVACMNARTCTPLVSLCQFDISDCSTFVCDISLK